MDGVRGTGTRGFGVGVRPADGTIRGIVLGVALALSTTTCSEPKVSEALVYVQNEGPQAPQYLLFSWLHCRDFIRRDDRVPEIGQLTRTDNPVATVLVQLDASEPTRRGVFIRGMVNSVAVSSGHAVVDIQPGVRSDVTVRLTGTVLGAEAAAAASTNGCPDPGPTPDAAPPDPPDAAVEVKLDAAADLAIDRTPFPSVDTQPPDTTPPMPVELERGLAGHWPFDEATGNTTPDRSPGNNVGNLSMGPSLVAGRVGAGALDLPGTQDLMEVRDPVDGRLDFGTGDFTVSVWIKTTQAMNAPDIVVKWPSNLNMTGPRAGWALTLPQGALLFKGFSEGTNQIGVAGPTVNDGQWHHVVGLRSDGDLVLWVDGNQVGTRATTLGNLSNTAPLWVGGFGTSTDLNFNGQIDDVRLYNRVLNPAEIRALASAAGP